MSCKFPINHEYLHELDITPTGQSRTYKRIASGISTVGFSNNDTVDQTGYLDGEGWNTSTVTGAQLTIDFTGHRDLNDDAQNYVDDVSNEVGCARETNYRWTAPDGTRKEGPCTLVNIDFSGGDAGAKSDIAYGVHLNGKPIYTKKTAAPELSIVVAAGVTSGTTTFTATPGAENTLAYSLTDASIGTVYGNQNTSGLNAYNSGDEIAATAGQYLNAYELNEYGRVVAFVEYVLQPADIAA